MNNVNSQLQLLTSPLNVIRDDRPTLKQLRERYQMSQSELAEAAGIRICYMYWMEIGVAVHRLFALKVLRILSQRANVHYCLEDVRGIRIKEDEVEY